MTQDLDTTDQTRPGSNLPEYSVGDLARALKRTIEDGFGLVRVRGEISQPKFHSSGHCYLRLKDEVAVIEAVIWKGVLARLSVRPEEGLEVIVQGRVTTYPGRSQYQLVVESMELAGEGALLKMLEERRRRLAAEGLFAPERKRRIPFLPRVIGVVTSPTGAVIRDILHRLADRFPRHVLLWPVAVQGETAARQIAAAIEGFNALPEGGAIPRPDVLIVARGGGSLEDLMPFNEEIVVRAAAASRIPLISAVGHETDTTLIDHAADLRAPTPTAAAEMAVPVRSELLARVADAGRRMEGAASRLLSERRTRIEGLARGLGDPGRLIETQIQRLDDRSERLRVSVLQLVERRRGSLRETAARLRHPREQVAAARARLTPAALGLTAAIRRRNDEARARFERIAGRLSARGIEARMGEGTRRLADLGPRLGVSAIRRLAETSTKLEAIGRVLEGNSPNAVLERGYVYVEGANGKPVTSAGGTAPGDRVTLVFHDGRVGATIEGVSDGPVKRHAKPRRIDDGDQGSLF